MGDYSTSMELNIFLISQLNNVKLRSRSEFLESTNASAILGVLRAWLLH